MKKIQVTLLFLISLLFSLAAWAGNKSNTLSLTVAGGYDYFSAKRHIDNIGLPLVMVDYRFTHALGIEGLLARFITRSHHPQDDNSQVRGMLFAVNGMYHFFHESKVQPFLLAGVGISSINPNGNDANNEGNINGGAGIQIFIDKPLALRVEVRDFYSTVGGKNDVIVDAGVTVFFDLC